MLKSLQARILLYSLLIASVPVLILGAYSYQAQRTLLEKEARDTLNSGTLNIVNDTYTYFSERTTDTHLLSTNYILSNPELPAETKGDELKRFVEAKRDYYGALFLNPDGKVIADTSNMLVGEDLSDRIWFKEALTGREFLSDVYMTKAFTGSIIALSAPVNDKNGHLIGVVTTAFRLSGLWNTMGKKAEEISDKYKVDFFMANEKGMMVSQNDPDMIRKDPEMEHMNFSGSSLREASQSNELYTPSKSAKIYSVKLVQTSVPTENKWYVAVGADKREVYGPLNDLLSRYLLIYTIVFITIILVVYLCTKKLVLPVQDLVRATDDFIDGKDFIISEKQSFEEMDRLNRAFRRMIAAIHEREKEIVRTEKLKYVGQLAAGVAHEIRNPLTTIKGFFQLMKSHGYDQAMIQKYSDVMLDEVDRVNEFVNQLLDLSKPHQLEWEKFNLKEFLEEIVSVYPASNSVSTISILTEIPGESLVLSDKNRLRQVILNVLNNACEAFDSNGEILINTECGSDHVRLIFRDNGKGITAENLKQIGMPFYTTKSGGNGLGVATCIQIMEELKGKFIIESTEGVGTRVTLIIPTINRLI